MPNKQKNTTRGGNNRSVHFYSYKGPLKGAVDVATHYGFNLIEPLTVTKRLPLNLSKSQKESAKLKDLSDFPKDYMSSLKKYIDDEMYRLPQPVMLCHLMGGARSQNRLKLEVLGTKKSVAEATIIKTALSVLEELGHKKTFVRLNSLGDKESGNSFLKELSGYYREHMSTFGTTMREQLKKDILKIYTNRNEKYREINENAPKPLAYLSEENRAHLKSLLEFLENLEINYETDNHLVGESFYFPKTIFEILDEEEGEILARGERHNTLAQNIGLNRKVPVVGVSINIKKRAKGGDEYQSKSSRQNPKIYFIHLGFEAKKKSLGVLEIFRKSKVPVYQSLCNDSFTIQFERAQNERVPYTMIMGQKEVLENCVIWRDMETRYQESIEISRLESFLTNLRKKKII